MIITIQIAGKPYDINYDKEAFFSLVKECTESLVRAKPGKFPKEYKLDIASHFDVITITVVGEITTPDTKVFDLTIKADISWTKIAENVYLLNGKTFPTDIDIDSRISLQKLIILELWTDAEKKLERNL